MVRSFSIVDGKVAETEFFLCKMKEVRFEFFELRCYLSAFTTSARTITYALQAVMKSVDGFETWYKARQTEMKTDPLACFFNKLRTVSHHIGDNLASAGSVEPNQQPRFWFMPTPDISEVPEDDVVLACDKYFRSLLELVYRCYVDFGPDVNSHQHYTAEYFAKLGKTIEDAEEEIIGVRGWTAVPGFTEEFRWQALRDQMPGCEIDNIFMEYLGKAAPHPPREGKDRDL